MASSDSDPATKGELNGVKGELNAVKGEVNAVKGEVNDLKVEVSALKVEVKDLKVEVKDLRVELKADIAASAKRLALEIGKTNMRMDRLDEDLRGEMRLLRSDVARTMDTAVSRMETLWKESVLLPRVVDDHERRISALENRSGRPTAP